jgi:hypothetical protein
MTRRTGRNGWKAVPFHFTSASPECLRSAQMKDGSAFCTTALLRSTAKARHRVPASAEADPVSADGAILERRVP